MVLGPATSHTFTSLRHSYCREKDVYFMNNTQPIYSTLLVKVVARSVAVTRQNARESTMGEKMQ